MAKLVTLTVDLSYCRIVAEDMGLLGPNASLIANLFKVHKILASRARVVVICGGPMAYMQWLTYRKNLDRAFERRLRNLEQKHAPIRDN